MTTQIDNKPTMTREPDFDPPSWLVSLNGADRGVVIRTKDGWAASRGIGWHSKNLGVFHTKLTAMHAVLGRGVKP